MCLERKLSLSPPDPSWGWAQGRLGKEALLGRQELEAGARPAPLPGSLGPISSGCFQAGPDGEGEREEGAYFQAKVHGCLFLSPGPLLRAAIESTLSVLRFLLSLYLGQGPVEGPKSLETLCVTPQAHLEAVLVLGMGID